MTNACSGAKELPPARDSFAKEFKRAELRAPIAGRAKYSGVVPHRLKRLRFWKNVLDPLSRLTPRRASKDACAPRRIGVLLQWGIGDAVLTLPLLNCLAQKYPGASIELIGKPWLADLFAGEPWLAEVHELVPPWTKPRAKYRLWDSEWRRYATQLRTMRKTRFDLLVGTRLDPRETVQLRLLNATRTAGVPDAGGERWITDPILLTAEDYYFRYRGEYNAIAVVGFTGLGDASAPRLHVSNAARAAALERLQESGYVSGPIICIHNSAGNPIREWRAGGFAEVIASVRDLLGYAVIIDDSAEPHGPGVEVPAPIRSTVWKSGLTDLKALLSIADVLLCCDSGVMHMAAACGSSVVAIFGPGSPETFFPPGERHQLVKVDPMPCRPCFDECIYPRPLCMDQITMTAVSGALRRAIASLHRPLASRDKSHSI